MNLYFISQPVNKGYGTYDAAVVCAEDEEDARMIHPDRDIKGWDGKTNPWDEWCEAKDVKVKFIGTSAKGIKRGVICASYNAG